MSYRRKHSWTFMGDDMRRPYSIPKIHASPPNLLLLAGQPSHTPMPMDSMRMKTKGFVALIKRSSRISKYERSKSGIVKVVGRKNEGLQKNRALGKSQKEIFDAKRTKL
uniref:Uncharacterized protein n=1 Tax=Vespula pensylvanica TaxID=30213 RepID=A0A834PH03_VESPE|nr:hypothetical protein H0235_001796 [Vespula pensylvanica]